MFFDDCNKQLINDIRSNNYDTVELLLNSGHIFDVNCKDESGNDLLFNALLRSYDNYNIMKLLIDNKLINLNALNDKNETPLIRVCANLFCMDEIIIELFLNNYINSNNTLNINTYINHQDKDGDTALCKCLIWRKYDLAEYLIQHNGADINLKSNNGWTSLHKVACIQANMACLERDIPVPLFELLLNESNCNINATDNYGNTPLHIACYNGNSNMVKLLIKYTAKIYIKCNDDHLPIDITSNMILTHPECFDDYHHRYIHRLLKNENNIQQHKKYNWLLEKWNNNNIN